MNAIMKTICSLLSGKTLTLLCELASTIRQLLAYLSKKNEMKHSEESKKAEDEFKAKVEDVIDNGTLADLKSLKRN